MTTMHPTATTDEPLGLLAEAARGLDRRCREDHRLDGMATDAVRAETFHRALVAFSLGVPASSLEPALGAGTVPPARRAALADHLRAALDEAGVCSSMIRIAVARLQHADTMRR